MPASYIPVYFIVVFNVFIVKDFVTLVFDMCYTDIFLKRPKQFVSERTWIVGKWTAVFWIICQGQKANVKRPIMRLIVVESGDDNSKSSLL